MMRRVFGLAIIGVAIAVAAFSTGAQAAPKNLDSAANGIYGFSFSGGSAITNGPLNADVCGEDEDSTVCDVTNVVYSTRLSGTGMFQLDGKGDVTGGIVFCSQSTDEEEFAQEWVGEIGGGQYEVLSDGTGFMFWGFDSSSGPGSNFCDSGLDIIDFTFTLVGNGAQMLFAVSSFDDDGQEASPAGHWKNASGIAYRTSTQAGKITAQ